MRLTDNLPCRRPLASHDHVERQQTALLTVINIAASVVAISMITTLNIRQHGAVRKQLQADAGLLCIANPSICWINAVKYSPR